MTDHPYPSHPSAAMSAFVTARLDEHEHAANECAKLYPAPWDLTDRGHTAYVKADEPNFWTVAELEQGPGTERVAWLGDGLAHVALHDPAFGERFVEAGRALVEEFHYQLVDTQVMPGNDWVNARRLSAQIAVATFAAIWSTHPDYDKDWQP